MITAISQGLDIKPGSLRSAAHAQTTGAGKKRAASVGMTISGAGTGLRSVASSGDGRESSQERAGHEAEKEHDQRERGGEAPAGIEGLGIEDGDEAKETDHEKERSPDVPALPEVEQPENDEGERKNPRGVAVRARTERAQDMAAVELRGR